MTLISHTWRPADSAQAAGDHHVAVGEGRLDLTATAFAPGTRTAIEATVLVGGVQVVVPRSTRVEVHATTRFGDILIDDELHSGPRMAIKRTISPDSADGAPPTIDLRVSAVLGDVEVRRAHHPT